MSFVFVKGELYRCDECGRELYVDFVEGLALLQVGNARAIQHLWSTASRKEYLVHRGICERCYRAKYNHPEEEDQAFELMKLIRLRQQETGDLKKRITTQREIRRLFAELNGRVCFDSMKISGTKNYNPFLEYERTLRTTVPGTPDEVWYVKVELKE